MYYCGRLLILGSSFRSVSKIEMSVIEREVVLINTTTAQSSNENSSQNFLADHWGDLASILGLIVSFVTLIVAQKAREAAKKAKNSVLHSHIITNVSEVISKMREVKTLQSQRDISSLLLLEKYDDIRERLVVIKIYLTTLNSSHKINIQDSINCFSELRKRAYEAISNSGELEYSPDLGEMVLKQIDNMQKILYID